MKKTLIILLVLAIFATSACGTPAGQPAAASDASPASEEANPPIVLPETYTDPSTVTVDSSVLVRADGQTLDWDAAPAEPAGDAPAEEAGFDASGWPDNEYTAGLPLPLAGKVSMAGEDDDNPGMFMIVFDAMPYESFLEYVELLKAAGYTVDASVVDYSSYGLSEGMSYSATGADGRRIEAVSAMGTTMLSVTLR